MQISRSKHGTEGRQSGHGQQSSSEHEQVHLISEGELCLDLINSEHFDYRGRRGVQDNLANPEWVTAFAHHWHLPVTSPPDALALAALRTLRALLRQMFEAAATGQSATDDQLEELRSEEHTSELQSRVDLVCRLLLEKKKKKHRKRIHAH